MNDWVNESFDVQRTCMYSMCLEGCVLPLHVYKRCDGVKTSTCQLSILPHNK